MHMTALRCAASLLLLLLCSGTAFAACTTTSSTLTFAGSSSYDVRAGSVQQVSGPAGLTCTGASLSLLGGSSAKATITSANGFALVAGGADRIAYQVSADSNGTYAFTQGGTVDYTNSSLIAILGLGASNFVPPVYARLMASPNVAEGTYTDTLTVQWDYNICNGLQVTFICLGYDSGKTTNTIIVTLSVSKDCRIDAPALDFGTAALVGQFAPVSQAVLVDCTKGATYKLSFSAGLSGSARPWRSMSDGAGHQLQYNIYRADGTTIWDESNPQTSASVGTGSSVPAQAPSYVAKINPAQSALPAGSYQDMVSVIVSF